MRKKDKEQRNRRGWKPAKVAGVLPKKTRGRRPYDLRGKIFDKLTVIGEKPELEKSSGHMLWMVRCDCGEVFVTRATKLKNGTSTRCKECANQDKFAAA